MSGNGHIIMGEAHEAAKRLKNVLWYGDGGDWQPLGIDPQAAHITVGIENDGEVTLRVGVDANCPRSLPAELPEFEGFRCKVVPFDGASGVQHTGRIKRSMFDG